MSQTSRQRILDALEHRSTDRVPIDFGSTNSTGITAPAYYRLLSHLGLDVEASVFDRAQQLVYINEEVLERFSVDTRGLIIKGPDRLDEELPN
ncbi:MAG: uroporphyrinogen-III decarboxylase, partial [Limnochordia bacterium]